jgi:hypothetical protein
MSPPLTDPPEIRPYFLSCLMINVQKTLALSRTLPTFCKILVATSAIPEALDTFNRSLCASPSSISTLSLFMISSCN